MDEAEVMLFLTVRLASLMVCMEFEVCAALGKSVERQAKITHDMAEPQRHSTRKFHFQNQLAGGQNRIAVPTKREVKVIPSCQNVAVQSHTE